MNQDKIILIEAGTPDFEMLKAAIARAEETDTYVRFYVDGPPACLKVKAYEGEWTPGIESHRPHGGYPKAERPDTLCAECDEPIDESDPHAGYGMCAGCLHDALRSGWTPGEGS